MYTPFHWLRPESLADFGTALRRQREALDLTLEALATATGISKPYLSNIETARSPGPPSEEKLRLLAAALHLPENDLLTGADWLRTPASIRRALSPTPPPGGPADLQGTADAPLPRRPDGTINLDQLVGSEPSADLRRRSSNPKSKNPSHPADSIPVRNVPLINRVPAGRAGEFTDLGYPAGVADQYVPAPDLPDAPASAAFALRVTGDSMAPEYADGEILIVGPGTARDGDDCVVRLGELEQFATTFKRVYFVRETPARANGEPGPLTAVRLVPLNPAHAQRTVSIDAVTGIYPLMYRLLPARSSPPQASPPTDRVPAPAPEPQSFTSRVSIEHD